MAVADNIKDGTVEQYEEAEKNAEADGMRTMGRKQLIPFGLYEVRGFISANLAAETGFDEEDFQALREAILNMYEHDRSASKREMAVVSPLILFKHVGTDSDDNQPARQAKLGCVPAHRLFELVHVQKKAEIEHPRSCKDYDAWVELGKLLPAAGGTSAERAGCGARPRAVFAPSRGREVKFVEWASLCLLQRKF